MPILDPMAEPRFIKLGWTGHHYSLKISPKDPADPDVILKFRAAPSLVLFMQSNDVQHFDYEDGMSDMALTHFIGIAELLGFAI